MIEISGYRLLRQLGRGGMATVYLALQESVEREVALKVMSPALLADPHFGARFLREAKIAARLHHRHVVGIHDVARSGDWLYIAMEYLAGGPILTQGGPPRDVPFALRVVGEIASALHYAHAEGFVHRDVKPDNILLRADGSAVLTDFGIARALDAMQRVTRTGTVVGTPHYMSPEQAGGRAVDGRSDLYSLGVVLYELLIGRVPWHADDPLALGIMHLTEPVPELPAPLAAVQPLLSRLLAKQPEERFQTGDEVARAARTLARQLWQAPQASMARAARSTPPPAHPATRVEAPVVPSAERAEPSLGRMDDIAAVLDGNDRNAASHRRRSSASRPSRTRRLWFGLLALAVLGVAAAWLNQDNLRHLLPRTDFNITLARAQQALASGHLTGDQGDSARELFLAARAQDPDNDVARRGLQEVGQRLLQQAEAELARDDLAAARRDLDGARELLGGGADVERLEQELAQRAAHATGIAQQLDAANAALARHALDGPDGAAALFQRILAAEPGNALAEAGLAKVADALAVAAQAALAAGDADTAAARADEIARILPSWPRLPELFGRIAQLRDTARAALAQTLERADAALKAGHLRGKDDAALNLYRNVLAKDPTNARAAAGLRQVAVAEVAAARRAMAREDEADARRLLDSASALAADLPELRAARSELRELGERRAIAAERAPVTPQQAAEVRRLVAEAHAAAQAGRIILPPGASAWDKYRAALAIDGDDAAAQAGLARLPARAKELLAEALAAGAPQRGRAFFEAIVQIDPLDAALPILREKLADAFLDQADARLGSGRASDAARALDAARELSPANPRIAPLTARLRHLEAAPGAAG